MLHARTSSHFVLLRVWVLYVVHLSLLLLLVSLSPFFALPSAPLGGHVFLFLQPTW